MRGSPALALAVTLVVLVSCRPEPDPDLSRAAETTLPAPVSTEPPAATSSPDAERAVLSPTTRAPVTATTTTAAPPPSATIAEPPPTSTTTTSTTHPTTTSTAPTTTTTSTTTTSTTTMTTVPPETEEKDEAPAVHEVSVTTVEFMPGLDADIHYPVPPGNYPVVALVFGGGWTVGDHTQLSALADYLASRGTVAVNGDHRTLLRGRRLPDMVGEVACLAAAAPHLAAPYLTGPPGPVWLLGYSSGAHLAALTTLTDPSPAPDCPHAAAPIAGMIGLGGPYDLDELWNGGIPDGFIDLDSLADYFPAAAPLLSRLDTRAMQLFLYLLTGLTPDDAEEWNALNPITQADQRPERPFLLLTGGEDEVTYPHHSARFAEALRSAGHPVSIEIIPHYDHLALTNPDKVGEIISSFVEE